MMTPGAVSVSRGGGTSAPAPAEDAILDEDGTAILDEDGTPILDEGAP